MKTKKTPAAHIDACPKSCDKIHKMCDWKGCASRGKHFEKDHVSPWAPR